MTKIWKVSPGYKKEFWKKFKQDECIAIGNWGVKGLGDLKRYNSKDDLKDAEVSASGIIQLWNFSREMKVRDIIIAYGKKCIWGVGKVSSRCYFKNDSRYWRDENYERLFGNPPIRYGILILKI